MTQQTIFSAAGLGAGAHTLVLTQRADSSGTGHYTDIDSYVTDDGAVAVTGTHYIDNSAGSGCSDAGAGTSTAAPWCDFVPVQRHALAAGASLLLARGDSWSGPLILTGSGTSSSWITLGAYGSATARPIIHGSGAAADRTIVLQNPDYWHVQDLELTNAGMGFLAEYTTLGHHGLDVHGLSAHDLSGIFDASPRQADYPDLQNSTAITVSAAGTPVTTAGQSVLSGLSIKNNLVHNAAGVYLTADPLLTGTPEFAPSTFTGVDISHNNISNSIAPMVAVEAAQGPIVEDNWMDCSGHHAEPQGTTCFFVSDVSSALIQNNVIMNMPDTGSPDETGIDFEYKVSNDVVRGNFFANNAGAGIELLQLGRAGDYSTGSVIEENTFYNNGGAGSSQRGQIAVYAPSAAGPSVAIQHNDYEVSPNGLVSGAGGSANTTNVTLTDNVAATTEYPSAWQFAATQGANGWSEQSYSGLSSSWTNMTTYTASPSQWTASSGSAIDAFVLTPGVTASQWVAREWTAPSAGTVQIRGRVFKADLTGPATSVLIERNGTPVWPTTGGPYATVGATDQSGINSDLTLTVAAGDIIRFVAYGNGSAGTAVSWTPSIDYK